MTIGMALGTFLIENQHLLARIGNEYIQVRSSRRIYWHLDLCHLQSLLFHVPRQTLFWLDAWPAGLKLNTQLSGFYVNMFVGIIDTWDCMLLAYQIVSVC